MTYTKELAKFNYILNIIFSICIFFYIIYFSQNHQNSINILKASSTLYIFIEVVLKIFANYISVYLTSSSNINVGFDQGQFKNLFESSYESTFISDISSNKSKTKNRSKVSYDCFDLVIKFLIKNY